MALPSKGFDFTGDIRRVCADMTRRVPELSHIDVERVAIGICQTRKLAMHGVFATLTPLRFEGGLVDFYSLREDRPIFLCWRLGEDRINHTPKNSSPRIVHFDLGK